MSEKVKISLDGKKIEADKNSTILEIARKNKIDIPTLCYLKEINEIGSCRVCMVEVNGKLQASCVTPVSEGLNIKTNSAKIRKARQMALELIISDHPLTCLTCSRNNKCKLQNLAAQYGINELSFAGEKSEHELDFSSPSLMRDPNKCILCRKCVNVCDKVQGVTALTANERGFNTTVSPTVGHSLADVACTNCGQCINVCPVAAITEKDDTKAVWAALEDPKKHVIVQTAPAVRVALGEEFAYNAGTLITGKMVSALKNLGFAKVFDTNLTADLTIMEEANELLERLNEDGELPLITSCSPGWIKYIEHFYPQYLNNLSTCKSPQQMFGALAKTYYAKKTGLDPKDIYVVSVMPCTAKKFEIKRKGMDSSGYQDVDIVLTTRELAKMIKQANLDFASLSEAEFDNPLGISTGAGTIFGNTGGVMEAALRTAYELVTKQELTELEFKQIRGLTGIKEAEINLAGKKLKVAVAHGLGNAHKIMAKIEEYDFVEVMACPGGCVGGGGQPYPSTEETIKLRAQGLYQDDLKNQLRKSHENPAVKTIYQEFLEYPLSPKAHHLLHTDYVIRSKFPLNLEAEMI